MFMHEPSNLMNVISLCDNAGFAFELPSVDEDDSAPDSRKFSLGSVIYDHLVAHFVRVLFASGQLPSQC